MIQPCKCGHRGDAHLSRCAVQWCPCLQFHALKPIEAIRLRDWVLRVLARCAPEPGSECVRWLGYLNAENHYGQCRVSIYYAGLDANGKRPKVVGAHRVLYSLVRGPIPPGFHIDHACENRWCVNPYHLEAMTQTENSNLGNAKRWHGATRDDAFSEPWVDFEEAIL